MKRKPAGTQTELNLEQVTRRVLAHLADLRVCSPDEVTAAYQGAGDVVIDSKQAEWIAAQLEEEWSTELLGEAALDPYLLTSVRSLSELFCQVLHAPPQPRPSSRSAQA